MSRDAWRFGESAAIPRFSWDTAASVDRQCALRDFIVVLAWDGAGKIDAYVVEVNRSISSYSSSGNLPQGPHRHHRAQGVPAHRAERRHLFRLHLQCSARNVLRTRRTDFRKGGGLLAVLKASRILVAWLSVGVCMSANYLTLHCPGAAPVRNDAVCSR